ncbi:MAG: zinc ribbon domain-containing protein [Chloroflexota bacterium]|nr:zinc ribbon domain-containing protein [Chloroflexota bacterium]
MTGAGTIQCPNCGTLMEEQARFCPGCGTPRTSVRERLEREAAATGVPYAQLLERERSTGSVVATSGADGWGVPARAAPAPTTGRSRIWLVLGIIGGLLLLLCVGCVVAAYVLIDRFDVDLGDSPEGDAAREQLQLATSGRHAERWERLHPDQQLVVPVDLFSTCAEYDGAGSVDILASFGDDNTFISRVGDVDARIVLYSISTGGSNETDFVEMVHADGEWHWTMDMGEIDHYEAGRCP